MDELVFDVVQEAGGCYCAECLTENIFTQADTWEEFRKNAVEAISTSRSNRSGTYSAWKAQ